MDFDTLYAFLIKKYPQKNKLNNLKIDIENFKTKSINFEKINEEEYFCKNQSCAFLNEEKEQPVEKNIYTNLYNFDEESVSHALTGYIHKVLKKISPIDLVKNFKDLRILNEFINQFSQYVKFYSKKNFKYFLRLGRELKKDGNAACYDALIGGIKSNRLSEEQLVEIKELEEMGYDDVVVININKLIMKISRTDSSEFDEIVDYFTKLQLQEIDRNDKLEKDIYRSIVDFREESIDYINNSIALFYI